MIRPLRPALAPLLALALLGACGAPDTGDAPAGSRSSAILYLPVRCADHKPWIPNAPDGYYILYAGDDTKPWLAWCKDMAGTPKEYLTVPQNADWENYAYYVPGALAGTIMATRYSKVRIDPLTLQVNLTDFTYATTTGSIALIGPHVPYATAGACVSSYNPAGWAQVRMTGTPFRIRESQFVPWGWCPTGSAVYAAGGQVVNLRGGGLCGHMHPQTPQGANALQLDYDATLLPASCSQIRARDNTAGDGEYLIYRSPGWPLPVYCKGMASMPTEYLTLPQGPARNFSKYVGGGPITGQVQTQFTKIRFDPATLGVKIDDYAFASSSGLVTPMGWTALSYGSTGSSTGSMEASGMIDLRGTPLAVAADQFHLDGGPPGAGAYDSDQQIVYLQVGGAGGLISTDPTSGWALQLESRSGLPLW